MKKFLLFLVLVANMHTYAQTFNIVKDDVIINKKVSLRIVKLSAGNEKGFTINNLNDESLVTVTQISEKDRNGTPQFLVSFAKGQMGISNSLNADKKIVIGNLLKTRAIISGLLFEEGIEKFQKAYLREISDEIPAVEVQENTKDEPTVYAVEVKSGKGKSEIVKVAPTKESKVQPLITDKQMEEVKPEPLIAAAGLFEDRDISKPVLLKGKTFFQDNYVVGSYATKIETEKGQKITKMQFKNYKGKFVAEVSFIKGENFGRLYNAMDKERTDIDILEDPNEEKIVIDLANQLLDLELL
jgi:hypothetical protein